ncbi:hypothetical protein [Limibacillus sp. MBR-115]|jgi:hypothetical protein|uniref:hypothetical protein n=1 Tax=Limibacillus sp. MBR-115 TaxID=3156465 RepID=UPI003391DACC
MQSVSTSICFSVMALLLLAACADSPRQEEATPAGTTAPGTTESTDTTKNAATESEPLVITPEPQDAKRQQAIESCYLYADAQVRSSQRIDQDINQRNSTMGFGGGYQSFKDQVDPYAYKQQRQSLFQSCMNSQGYGKSE